MKSLKFLPGDLVLANILGYKRPSQCSTSTQRNGYWPAKITQKLQNCKRQVICYGTHEEVKVTIQNMIAYDKESKKVLLTQTQVNKDSLLALALDEIEADFLAKTRTAEQLHLSGEPKLITSVVKSANLLETNNINNTVMHLWNFYIEKSIGKTSGICHLPRILIDFVNDHKETMSQEDAYKDFICHICSLEEMGLISSNEVKTIVDNLAAFSFVWNHGESQRHDGTNNVIENDLPSERTKAVFRERNFAPVLELHSDTPTSLLMEMDHCSEILNEAESNKVNDISKHGINEGIDESASSVTECSSAASILDSCSVTIVKNSLPDAPTPLEIVTPADVVDNLVDTSSSFNVLNDLTQTSSHINCHTNPIFINDPTTTNSILEDLPQSVSVNPSNACLLAPIEPLDTASLSGDVLDQETYKDEFSGGEKTMMNNNSDKFSEEIMTSEITIVEEICPDMANDVTEAVENGIVELDKEVVEAQENRKNLNNKCVNEQEEGLEVIVIEENYKNEDDEVEIIDAVGSTTFVDTVLNCHSEGKQLNRTKRKRPTETMKTNKKHLPHHQNTDDVSRVNGTSSSQSNPKQALQGYCRCFHHQTRAGILNLDAPCFDGRGRAAAQTNKQTNSTRIDKSGPKSQDVNGNSCHVKITMNIEMSADCFSRVTEGFPNLREMVDKYADAIIVNVDSS